MLPRVDAATIDVDKHHKVTVGEASAEETEVDETKKKKKKAIGFRERRVSKSLHEWWKQVQNNRGLYLVNVP